MSQHILLIGLYGLIFSFVWYYYRTPVTVQDSEKKKEVDLAICILSARDHFSHRDAIRETWLDEAQNDLGKRIKAKFVVGNDACDISPEDRVDRYTCEEWMPQLIDDVDVAAFSMKQTPDGIQKTVVSRLAVRILHTVVIKRIGVISHHPLPVTVTLWNGVTDEEIDNVVFNSQDPGIEYEGYRYQAIQPLRLSKKNTA